MRPHTPSAIPLATLAELRRIPHDLRRKGVPDWRIEGEIAEFAAQARIPAALVRAVCGRAVLGV